MYRRQQSASNDARSPPEYSLTLTAVRAPVHMPTVAATKKAPNNKKTDDKLDARQLLGLKGAAETDNKWAIRLQLTKPVTWVPLIWGVLCGAAASGEFTWTAENVAKSLLCMTMSGPLLTGYTQVRLSPDTRSALLSQSPSRSALRAARERVKLL